MRGKLTLGIASLMLLLAGSLGFANSHNAIVANAEPEQSSVEEQSSEESVVESSSEEQSSEEQHSESALKWKINEAQISYRDSEGDPYVPFSGNGQPVGDYFLSADGWGIEDEAPIIMNVKGAVTTKLDNKVVYIYEYRPTIVTFAGKIIAQNEDKTFTLAKPVEQGEYDLSIAFTKFLIVNPVELTKIDWASFLTVPNLLTVLSWAVIAVGILVMFFLNRKYKKKDGQTTLGSVKKELTSYIDDNFGAEVSGIVSDVFDKVVKESYNAINGKLDKLGNNNATLVRCLLLMQENTPDARLAITKCLSELDIASDGKADEVKALIEAEIKKYKEEEEAKREALRKAKEINDSWEEAELPDEDNDGDSDGGYGSL